MAPPNALATEPAPHGPIHVIADSIRNARFLVGHFQVGGQGGPPTSRHAFSRWNVSRISSPSSIFSGQLVGPTLRTEGSTKPIRDQRQCPQQDSNPEAQKAPLPEGRRDGNRCHDGEDGHAVPAVTEQVKDLRRHRAFPSRLRACAKMARITRMPVRSSANKLEE